MGNVEIFCCREYVCHEQEEWTMLHILEFLNPDILEWLLLTQNIHIKCMYVFETKIWI